MLCVFASAAWAGLGAPGYVWGGLPGRADACHLAAVGAPRRAPTAVARAPSLQRVAFVPRGGPAALNLATLASHYEECFGIAIDILPPIEPNRAQMDSGGRQFVAEELITLMRQSHSALDADPGTLLIGFTESDMNIRAIPEWRYPFAPRTAGRFAVISSARMRLGSTRWALPDLCLAHTRVRKMFTKTIGSLYFGRPLNPDPTSVLFDSVLSVDDLSGRRQVEIRPQAPAWRPGPAGQLD